MSQQAFKFCRVRRFAVYHALDGLTMQDIGVKVNRRKRVLSNRELRDLLTALHSDFFAPYYQNIIFLLLAFGARTVELRLSEIREWDLRENLWTVPEKHSKSGEKIIRPIPDRLIPMITRLLEENRHTGYLLGEMKRIPQLARLAHTWLRGWGTMSTGGCTICAARSQPT